VITVDIWRICIYIYILVITVDNCHIYRLWLICGIYIGDHGRHLAYISILTVDIWFIYRFVRYFSLSDKMSHLDVISNTLTNINNTTNVTPSVEAHRRYRGVVYCRNVVRFHSLRVFLCAHNNGTTFRHRFSIDLRMLNCIMCKSLIPKPKSKFGQFGQTFTDAPR